LTISLNSDLRAEIAKLVHESHEGHIPSSFSIVDIVESLYANNINLGMIGSEDPNRDFFFLSKGHGALALYVVLRKFGLVSEADLASYGQSGSAFAGHPDRTKHPAIEASTGSLGHGLPMAVGVALGKKIQKASGRVFCLIGDGETHEGTIWEAAHFAANHNLDNLIAIVDRNDSALQLLPTDNLVSKFLAFGWEASEVDGHNLEGLQLKIRELGQATKPKVFIAKTVKGKGVPFMEGHGQWHHKVPNDEELRLILEALGENL